MNTDCAGSLPIIVHLHLLVVGRYGSSMHHKIGPHISWQIPEPPCCIHIAQVTIPSTLERDRERGNDEPLTVFGCLHL